MVKARRQTAARKTIAPGGKSKPPARKRAPRGTVAPFSRLVSYALSFPDAAEERPWGETAIKVRGKIFVFVGGAGLTGNGSLMVSHSTVPPARQAVLLSLRAVSTRA